MAKRQRNQTIFHQNLINVIQSSIRLIKFIGIIYRCNNLRLVRRRLSNHSLYWIKKKLSNSFKFNDCSHVSSKASGVKRNGSNTVNGCTFAHYVLRTYIFYVISVTNETLYKEDNVYLLFHESSHDISSCTFFLTLTVCAISAREKSGKKENS